MNSPICTDLGQSGTTSNDYYATTYSQKQTGGNEVVAKFSVSRDTVDHTGKLCGLTNTHNYGLFNNTGFISDGVAAASIASNYPSYARVDANLSRAQGAEGDWDDIEASTIDAFDIQFNDSSSAPF